jgi:hypothetical protein
MYCILPSLAYIFASSNLNKSLFISKLILNPNKMRTLKNLSLTFILIIFVHALSYAVIFGEENFNTNTTTRKTSSVTKVNRYFVHTALRNCKIIPAVMLPVVTISAERNTKNMVQATRKGKTIIAVVDLPEVVISGEKKTPGYKLKTVASKNGIIPLMNLPEVVIIAERKNSNTFAWQKTNENNIPVVNLSEVIISADFQEYNMVKAVFYKGAYIASVNLPEVVITADKPEKSTASDDEDRNSKNVNFNFSDFVKVEAKANQSLNLVIFILAKASSLKF